MAIDAFFFENKEIYFIAKTYFLRIELDLVGLIK
jgi:hypothetical protein